MMTWSAALSTFFLSRVCEFIKNRVPMDQGFRMKDLKVVIEVVLKLCWREVHSEQIYSHLGHWHY
jgi:hypothetical protein